MLDGKGVDFGNRAAKEKYMDALFGPNPPAINQMKFTVSSKVTPGFIRVSNQKAWIIAGQDFQTGCNWWWEGGCWVEQNQNEGHPSAEIRQCSELCEETDPGPWNVRVPSTL